MLGLLPLTYYTSPLVESAAELCRRCYQRCCQTAGASHLVMQLTVSALDVSALDVPQAAIDIVMRAPKPPRKTQRTSGM